MLKSFLLFFCIFVIFQVKPLKRELSINNDKRTYKKQKQTHQNQLKKLQTKQVNNYLYGFIDDGDMHLLSQVSKSNNKNTKESLMIRNKYKTAFLTNNTETIKEMLSTKTELLFIIEKCSDYYENKMLWKLASQNKDISLLRKIKSKGIQMNLSSYELVEIIYSFDSVDYYETFEFLLGFIKLNDDFFEELIEFGMYELRTPTTKEQQNSQFEIYKKLIKYKDVENRLKDGFLFFIESLNIPLVDFVIKELDYKNNEEGLEIIYEGLFVIVVIVLNRVKNKEFALEMFDHLLSINKKDINTRQEDGTTILYWIEQINDQTIKDKLLEIIKEHILTNTNK